MLTDESLMDFSDWLIDISFLSDIHSLLKLWLSFLIIHDLFLSFIMVSMGNFHFNGMIQRFFLVTKI